MRRREFVTGFAATAAGLCFPGCVSQNLNSTESLGRLAFFTVENSLVEHPFGQKPGGKNSLQIFNIGSNELIEYALPIKSPHSLIQHPFMKQLAVVTPRDEQTAAVIDLNTGKIISLLKLKNDLYFYGHGVFSADGKQLLLSGYDKNNVGFLKSYDLNWSEQGYVDTFGLAPHDVQTIHGGETLLVANNGWSGLGSYHEKRISGMAYVDFKTKKLVEKIELPLGYLGFQHFDKNDRGDFVAGCDVYGNRKTQTGFKSLLISRKFSDPMHFFDIDNDMKARLQGNILSIAWNQKNSLVLTTTPEGPVTIWDASSLKAVRQILDYRHPHGVSTSQNHAYITTANNGLWHFNLNSVVTGDPTQIQLSSIQNISAHSCWLD